jgi:hypothetical protein
MCVTVWVVATLQMHMTISLMVTSVMVTLVMVTLVMVAAVI